MLHLENMRPGEKVITVIKRHWIVYVILGIYFFIGIIISISVYLILGTTVLSNLTNIVFWLFFSVFLYIEWLNHELDMYVVTNNRVIGIDQISFLNRNVSECNLGQVQEVNSKTSGLFANILNYGTLSIQTAGNVTTLKMDFCPDSMQAARKLLNVVDDYRDKQNIKGPIENK
ncbi:MAG: PH domain-containing protein [Candidatus Gracilibacteria bacterium]|nr:PH domain-containing protein [Candidatus Gracilibacteria bacterium]